MSAPARVRRSAAAAALTALALVGSACSSGTAEPDAAPSTTPETAATGAGPTPISALDPGGLTVARADFCASVSPDAVAAAVGEVRRTDHYVNGEPARLTPDLRDVAHEFGCVFRGRGGTVARAWVFAPRITRARARALVGQARSGKGCEARPADTFGSPATGLVCRAEGATSAGFRGLFVDSWFSCSLSREGPTDVERLAERAESWCVAAVRAAAAG
ncbi:hypothetical protein [Nocardioides donggukensis]|uniref:DUF3558 domain-containing protein n=1 Tax=Nocardioides donggukensis TaxID=2774019 RepID=A0A927K4A1_9ACTN|nr:hypothetical protein [Nocardioides donggukensis]MBD8868775.1 hypothetical protein [Nocardioides donggukensis]